MSTKFIQSIKSVFRLKTLILILSLVLVSSQIASADFCSGLSGEFGGFIECSEEFTSFSKFQGGLEAPSADGYDATLTQATDARTFVKNIANFALGFLGLAAVLIIIYSGFLYVTSAVNSDATETAKNNIKYSVIGIFIILGSFAFVNTILTAPGGGAAGGAGGGAGQSDSTNAQQLANYNTAANEIKVMTRDLIKAYERAQDDLVLMNKIKSFQVTEYTSRENFANYLSNIRSSLNQLASRRGSLSNTGVAARTLNLVLIDQALLKINGIVQEERVSDLRETVGESGLESLWDDIVGGIGEMITSGFSSSGAFTKYICSLPAEERPVNIKVSDCKDDVTDPKVTSLGTEVQKLIVSNIDSTLKTGIYFDFHSEIYNINTKLVTLKAQVTGTPILTKQIEDLRTKLNNIDSNYETKASEIANFTNYPTFFGLFDKNINIGTGDLDNVLFGDVKTTNSTTANTDFTLDTDLKDFISGLQELYNILKAAKFTIPVITASVTTGTAPLVVTFDGSGSINPEDLTLNKELMDWDVDGDGIYGLSEGSPVKCLASNNSNNTNFIFKTCTFQEPGSYRVGLRLRPTDTAFPMEGEGDDATANNARSAISDPTQTLYPGIAYVTIRVLPQSAKIQLNAQVGSESANKIVLRKYEETSNRLGDLQVDVEELFLSSVEARAGITLDASGTKSDTEIVNYSWRFSDEIGQRRGTTSGDDQGANTQVKVGSKIEKTFDSTGIVNAILEVKDSQGNADRKIFKIIIADHVPRISTNKTSGLVMDEFVLDASRSVSAMGLFQKFKWSIEDVEALDIIGSEEEVAKVKFNKAGLYKVKLSAFPQGVETNSDANAVNAEVQLLVNPRSPIGVINANFTQDANPGLVIIDAKGSQDGDQALFGSDEEPGLVVNWKVVNASHGNEFLFGKINSEDNIFEVAQIEGTPLARGTETYTAADEDTEVALKFLKSGRYTILLELQKVVDGQTRKFASVTQKNIVVSNVIDLDMPNEADVNEFAASLNPNSDDDSPADELSANLSFQVTSQTADKIQVFFGDGKNEFVMPSISDGDDVIKSFDFSHKYVDSGTYSMRVIGIKGLEKHEIQKTVTIKPVNTPVPVISITDSNGNVLINQNVGGNAVDDRKVLRGEVLRISAKNSLNRNGGTDNLTYSFNTGDGRTFGRDSFDLKYSDLPTAGNMFSLELTITDSSNDEIKKADQSIDIFMGTARPEIESVQLSQLGTTTPFALIANAVGAKDLDSQLGEFTFELFNTTSDGPVDVVKSSQPRVSMIVPTDGDTGEEVRYYVKVKVEESELNLEDVAEESLAVESERFTVVNGQNERPTAKFTVDRTSVTVGEEIEFFSSASDIDGTIEKVFYDLNGNGSFIDDGFGPTGPRSTDPKTPFKFTFNKKSPASGYRIAQMVVDDAGSRAVSRPLTIFVDSTLDDPKAAFETDVESLTVNVRDKSTLDLRGGASKETSAYKWDKDINTDSNGDGISDNDVDSTDINPVFTYSKSGKYRVKLTLEDLEGNIDTVINTVEVGGNLKPPVAAFLLRPRGLAVNTENKSRVDTENGGSIRSFEWDFDTTVDSDGDGRKDNDIDSTDTNPVIEYATTGTKKVKLTVTDSEGNTDTVINTLQIGGNLAKPVAAFLFEVSGLDVSFENTSRIDSANGGEIREIFYDINGAVDSDGDGNKVNDRDYIEPSFTHTYETAGKTEVIMTIIDNEGNRDSIKRSISVGADVQPAVAAFIFTVNNKTVSIENKSRADEANGSSITEYVWDFDVLSDADGDGVKDNDIDSQDESPSDIEYEEFGEKQIRLTVKDTLGNIDTLTKQVILSPKETREPTPAFLVTTNQLEASFVNNSSADSENQVEIEQFIWDFDTNFDADGNGDPADDAQSNEKNPTVTYEQAGTFEVKLTVVDSMGKQKSLIKRVQIEASESDGPTAAFTFSNDGLNVSINNNSRSGEEITDYEYDFNTQVDSDGDGVRDNDIDSSQMEPSFSYPASGVYEIKLTVTDAAGRTDTVKNRLRVEGSDIAASREVNAAEQRVRELEARLAELEAGMNVVSDPAETAVERALTPAEREEQRQAEIRRIQENIIAQQESVRAAQEARDAEIRRIQEEAQQQRLDREAAGLQSDLSASSKRVVPLFGSDQPSRDTGIDIVDAIGGELDDFILDDDIIEEDEGEEPASTPSVEFDPQNFIVSNPSVSELDQIGISGNSGVVRLSFNHLPEFIERVIIDKNIFADTNSGSVGSAQDGVRNNDVDFVVENLSQSLDIEYSINESPARMMMTLIDSNNNIYIDQVSIVFGMAAR